MSLIIGLRLRANNFRIHLQTGKSLPLRAILR
jgi:hypothetical protein